MNKKISSEIAIGIILLVAIVVGGIFYWQSKKVQTVAPVVSNQQLAVSDRQVRPVENQQTQIPKAGYKILKISDGTTAFSFEIPEKWLTETRHSGEKQLTVEEMRDFLATNFDGDIKTNPKLTSDYADLPWTEIKKMSDNEIKELYNRKDKDVSLYPNASVGAGDHILYTDTSWQQIDFYIKNEPVENVVVKVKKEHDDYCKEYGNDIVACGDDVPMWEQTVVGEKNTEVEIFMTDKDEKGNEVISKGGTGGKTYFVKISNARTLVISKQAKGDTKFETDFNNLIQTFKFTDITDETANWQTYKNENYGFEFKYPKDLSAEQNKNIEDYFSFDIEELNTSIAEQSYNQGQPLGINLQINKTNYKNIDDWFTAWKKDFEKPSNYEGVMIKPKVESIADINVVGVKAKKYVPGGHFPFYDLCISFIKNGYEHSFCYDGGLKYTDYASAKIGVDEYGNNEYDETKIEQAKTKYRDLFNKIMSTFKFTK